MLRHQDNEKRFGLGTVWSGVLAVGLAVLLTYDAVRPQQATAQDVAAEPAGLPTDTVSVAPESKNSTVYLPMVSSVNPFEDNTGVLEVRVAYIGQMPNPDGQQIEERYGNVTALGANDEGKALFAGTEHVFCHSQDTSGDCVNSLISVVKIGRGREVSDTTDVTGRVFSCKNDTAIIEVIPVQPEDFVSFDITPMVEDLLPPQVPLSPPGTVIRNNPFGNPPQTAFTSLDSAPTDNPNFHDVDTLRGTNLQCKYGQGTSGAGNLTTLPGLYDGPVLSGIVIGAPLENDEYCAADPERIIPELTVTEVSLDDCVAFNVPSRRETTGINATAGLSTTETVTFTLPVFNPETQQVEDKEIEAVVKK